MKVDDLARRFENVDPRTIDAAREAARTWSVHGRMFSDAAAAALRAGTVLNWSELSGLHKAAEAVAMFKPIVTPQIAEAFMGDDVAKRVAAAFPTPEFNFAKLVDLDIGAKAASAFQTVAWKDLLGSQLDEIVKSLPATFPSTMPSSFVPSVEAAAQQALLLAESAESPDPVDAATVDGIDRMTAAEKRMLVLDVAVLIVALLFLAAWLEESGDPSDLKGAGFVLGCAAALMRVYWRACRKL